LPWSPRAPSTILRSSKTPGAVKACGPPRPVPRRVTSATRSVSVRDPDKIFLVGIKSKLFFGAVNKC